MSDHQADYPIATMCQLLGVSPSGYDAWRKRQPSQRSETDAAPIEEIQVAHAGSRGTYGAPRIHAELAAKGTYIGRKRVARLMTQAGLAVRRSVEGLSNFSAATSLDRSGSSTASRGAVELLEARSSKKLAAWRQRRRIGNVDRPARVIAPARVARSKFGILFVLCLGLLDSFIPP